MLSLPSPTHSQVRNDSLQFRADSLQVNTNETGRIVSCALLTSPHGPPNRPRSPSRYQYHQTGTPIALFSEPTRHQTLVEAGGLGDAEITGTCNHTAAPLG